MSPRTLSQRDYMKRMRRYVSHGDVNVNDDKSVDSEYEDESLSSEETQNQSRLGFIGMFKPIDSKIEF